jgi:hypothetical protein
MATPNFNDVMAAVEFIEDFIKNKADELRRKYPDSVQMIDRAIGFLNAKERTLTALRETLEEIRVFLPDNKGPVEHDPVDLS